MKKLTILAATLLLCGVALAQETVPPKPKTPNEQRLELEAQQARMAMLQSQAETLNLALSNITEFKKFMQLQAEMQKLQNQMTADAAAKTEAAKPAAVPAPEKKPVTPRE